MDSPEALGKRPYNQRSLKMNKYLLIAFSLVATQAWANDSTYTNVDVDSCTTIETSEGNPDAEIDYYTGICRGVDSYQVKISGGDLRYGLSLIYKGQEIEDLTKISSFHDMGSTKIEWRYEKNSRGQKIYKALIFRIRAYENDTNVDYLHVVKLNGSDSCTVAVLTGLENMNEAARKIADSIDNYSCQ